jgi:hypothetical protein
MRTRDKRKRRKQEGMNKKNEQETDSGVQKPNFNERIEKQKQQTNKQQN